MADSPAETNWEPDDDLAARVNGVVERCQQGDVMPGGFTVHVADASHPLTKEAAELGGEGVRDVFIGWEAVAIVSQTCDVVRGVTTETGGRPLVQVSPVVRLEDDRLHDALRGRVPRYAPVPGFADDAFVDLDICTTIEKTVLAGSEQVRGCPDDESSRAFGHAVARHRSRFAFPDHVDRAMQRLRKRMVDRADKDSPAGRRVDEVVEIRATAVPQWNAVPLWIELVFLVDEAALPAVDADDEASDATRAMLGKNPGEKQLSEALEDPGLTAADRSVLWMALAETWTRLVTPAAEFGEITGVAESRSSYSRARHDTSERLDLDHLSSEPPPQP